MVGYSADDYLRFSADKETIYYSEPVYACEDAYVLPTNDNSEQWGVRSDGHWTYVNCLMYSFPPQGWKIHITSTIYDAQNVLYDVAEYLFVKSISFKYLSSRTCFIQANGKYADRLESGKFITIYPSSEHIFIQLLKDLKTIVCKYDDGPYILTDKQWQNSNVFFRYGALKPRFSNEKNVPVIVTPQGDLIPDKELPLYSLPSFVDEPIYVKENNYFMLILVMFFAYFVGKTFAWKELAAQLKQNKLRYEKLSQHVEYLRKESVVASRIHDSVAGNLAYMAILLDGLILDAEKNKTFDEKEIREVRALVVETLDEVRSVVDLMNGGKTESVQADNMSLSGLQIVGEQGDSFLKELGFHGKTRIALKDLKNLDDAFSREVFSLIHELYTNIAVHGSPGGEYRLIVFWDDDDLIHVDQVNDISSKNLFPDKPVSGNGLSLHMKWIKSIGGFAKTSSEKGAWQFHARFPVIMSEDSAEPV